MVTLGKIRGYHQIMEWEICRILQGHSVKAVHNNSQITNYPMKFSRTDKCDRKTTYNKGG
jgi:hypothetical protein